MSEVQTLGVELSTLIDREWSWVLGKPGRSHASSSRMMGEVGALKRCGCFVGQTSGIGTEYPEDGQLGAEERARCQWCRQKCQIAGDDRQC